MSLVLLLISISLFPLLAQVTNGAGAAPSTSLVTPTDDPLIQVHLSEMQKANWYYDAYFAADKAEKQLVVEGGKLELERNIFIGLDAVLTVSVAALAVEVAAHWK